LTDGGGFAILSRSPKSLNMIFAKLPLRITKVIGLALILVILNPGSSSADIIITEFMASNNSVIDDEDGDSSDWIEIYNTGPAIVNLDGFHLTDDQTDLTKWRIPNVTIAAKTSLSYSHQPRIETIRTQNCTQIFASLRAGTMLA
jgi:predicted nuclease of predicted toxin-antitoxin system